ncbi:hypothetical protein FIU94_14125 [Sulfitobacter sp. THAF37]|uniref:STAS domain-containing protein n=1 Tax=Sulfitobacter sp. THAF37 TaxID=2587855 RepID=UPI0012683A48|nr:STAS domain-containing protein [Sulfitobacter sp. THAF37]QFT59965.1 hypothetical protein FIU94_14125 [Sulfitobacter sp. THAF37]
MSEPLIPESRLNVTQAASLHAAMKARAGEDLTVDMRQVVQLGALCLQVLVAAGKSARTAGETLQLINVSDQVLAQMNVMGLSPEAIAEGRQ